MRDIEDYTEKYTKNNFELNYQVKYRRKKVLELLYKYSHEKVLEIGCGMHSVAKDFHDFLEFTIVEPSEAFARKAEQEVERADVIHGTIENVATFVGKKDYDYIIVSALLHEVENPAAFLKIIHQLCTPRTIIHINVPNAKSFHRLLAYESRIIDRISSLSESNFKFQQHSIFDMGSLKALLSDTAQKGGKGITIVESGSYFVKPFAHAQMEQCLKHRIFGDNVIEGFDQMIKYLPDMGSEIYMNYKIQ